MATIETLTANPAAEAGRFVDSAERDALAGQALRIVGMVHDARNRYGPRWLVSVVVLANGEKLAIGLADNDARNAMYPAIAAVLDDEGADGIDPVVLYRQKPDKGGNPFWNFRTATSEEIDAAADAPEETDAADDDEPAPDLAKAHRARR